MCEMKKSNRVNFEPIPKRVVWNGSVKEGRENVHLYKEIKEILIEKGLIQAK